MKKFLTAILCFGFIATNTLALEGELGYFGGTTPGTKIPDSIVLAQTRFEVDDNYVLPYKETVYLTGKPIVVEGTLEIQPGEIDPDSSSGGYSESYIIRAISEDEQTEISRTLTLDTIYAKNDITGQVTKSSNVGNWTEMIVAEGTTYTLDPERSNFSKSIIEDYTPGVKYYSGDIYYTACYTAGADAETIMEVDSRVYGYDQAFAKSEVQQRSIIIDDGENQYYIEETPSTTMTKELSYSGNQPIAISFAGNYKEVIQGQGSTVYNMLIAGDEVHPKDQKGSFSVKDSPSIAQLSTPSIESLIGHPAKSDVAKLYAMGIFDKRPEAFSTNQVVTRGEYIKMLVKALKIPLPDFDDRRGDQIKNPFEGEISADDSFYPYYLAAYEAGLIIDTVNANDFLTREQMIVFNIRALGLSRLGANAFNSQMAFIDDSLISDYAKSSIYAATKIGILPITNGYLFPQKYVTYQDCAALLNDFINYLRYDLQKDYNQYIMTW
ncbi:MAG: hypothetical protein ATN31_07735 [Candidatus Epulonipiscioides saccharophilum]|nr:MAG: hypothetical protein ATN31_07735 [Epulopiscium sp. AS2M-Bin001]